MASMMLPGGGGRKARGHGGHAAVAVNHDTKTWQDMRGKTHDLHPDTPPPVDGHTEHFKLGHPVMTTAQHKAHDTPLYRHMERHSRTRHPNAVMKQALKVLPSGGAMPLPGGSPAAPLLPPGQVAPGAPMPFALPGGRAG